MNTKTYRHNSIPPQDQKLANIQLWRTKSEYDQRIRTVEGLIHTKENISMERVSEFMESMSSNKSVTFAGLTVTGDVLIGGTPGGNPAAKLHVIGTVTGGSGDYTDAHATLKIEAKSSHPRIAYTSAHASVSTVYNFQTGKDVYWGENGDTGSYVFRGRAVEISGFTKLGGTERLKVYTYSNSPSAGDITNKFMDFTITAVTMLKVRGIHGCMYDASDVYVETQYDETRAWALRFQLRTTTSLRVSWPGTLQTNDVVSFCIIVAE